jgi:hypothetical protein
MYSMMIYAGIGLFVALGLLTAWQKWGPKGILPTMDTASQKAVSAVLDAEHIAAEAAGKVIAGLLAALSRWRAFGSEDCQAALETLNDAVGKYLADLDAEKDKANSEPTVAAAPTIEALQARLDALESRGITYTVPSASLRGDQK